MCRENNEWLVQSSLCALNKPRDPRMLAPLTPLCSAGRRMVGLWRLGPLLQEVLLARRGGLRGQDQETLLHQPHS